MKPQSQSHTSMKSTTYDSNNLDGKLEGAKSISIYIKILINYSQMMGIIKTLDFGWPNYVVNLFSFLSNLGFFSIQILTLDCFWTGMKALYLRAIATLIFYVSFLFTAMIFFTIRKLYSRKKNIFNKFIMFFLVFSVMLQPNFIKENSDIFSCKKVINKSYLLQQMSLECYTNEHFLWVDF